MARAAQTDLAVLGGLSIAPMTGYEVRSAITSVLGHFWHESFGQIYPALNRLERDGLIARGAAGRTSGSTFRLTEAGRERLRLLLAEPWTAPPPRNGMLLRLFFGSEMGKEAVLDLLREAEQGAEARLSELEQVRRGLDEESPQQTLRTMTLSYGEHLAAAQRAWARECLETLAGHEQDVRGPAGEHR